MNPRWLLVPLLVSCLVANVQAAQTRAFVVTSDFSSGGLSTIGLAPPRPVTPDVATVHSDARVRWYGGLVYVINRFGQDNIQVIDPAQGYATVRQFSTGNGSNPQDIAFVSATKAYVTRLGSPNLLRVNPTTGDTLGPISLAAYADADGLPEMERMRLVGNRLFVQLQRLVNFLPADSSLVAVIDTDVDTVMDANHGLAGIQAITLQGQNPVTPFAFDPLTSRLFVGCVGSYGVLDGGIERINPVTLQTEGYAITEGRLNGDVLDLVWKDGAESYAIVSDASFNTALVSWSPNAGIRLATLFNPGGFSLSDVERNDRDELYVCRSDFTTPGVYVFSSITNTQLAGPLNTGLPPQSLAFDAGDAVASVERPTLALELAATTPNPARTRAHLALSLPSAATVRAEVIDAGGRRVRSLLDAPLAAGIHTLEWRLDGESGRPVPAGVYFVRVVSHTESGGEERKGLRAIVVVR